MMMNEDEQKPYGVELYWLSHGHAEKADVIVDGFKVPYITVWRKKGGPDDGKYTITLSRATGPFFSIDVDEEIEIQRWASMLANAMAVAAGFTCFGKGSSRMNPFASEVHTI